MKDKLTSEAIIKKLNQTKTNHELPNDNSGEYNYGYVKAINYAINLIQQQNQPSKEFEEALTSDVFVENCCLSYNHGFGLLSTKQQDWLRFEAKEWFRAILNNLPYHKQTTIQKEDNTDKGEECYLCDGLGKGNFDADSIESECDNCDGKGTIQPQEEEQPKEFKPKPKIKGNIDNYSPDEIYELNKKHDPMGWESEAIRNQRMRDQYGA